MIARVIREKRENEAELHAIFPPKSPYAPKCLEKNVVFFLEAAKRLHLKPPGTAVNTGVSGNDYKMTG